MITRRTFLAATAAAPLSIGFGRPARANTPPVFAVDGLAIRGADPVAFFTQNAPVVGSADHALTWDGATWHFASAAHLEAFMGNPQAYAPQYGGYCAFAVASGYTASTVPEAWTIYEGRLYLNYSTGVRSRWERDIPGHIAQADANWPQVLS